MTLSLENQLLLRKKQNNFRQLTPVLPLIDFSSNDYLGLARSSDLMDSIILEQHRLPNDLKGFGSTGSRLLSGNSQYAQDLENTIAAFHAFDSGVIFNCGYMANVGLLSTVARQIDTIFFDSRVHASTRDGIRLSRAQSYPFKHNNLAHLEQRLKNGSAKGNRFICIESIYSTSGKRAPLVDISTLAKRYDAHLIVDEAHAVGVYGPKGRGLVAEADLHSSTFALIVTFGKALGTHGAIVLGRRGLIDSLINFATPFIYTTALPFFSFAAIKCSYDYFPKCEPERSRLHRLIDQCNKIYAESSGTQIQSIKMNGNKEARYMAQKLAKTGFDVKPLLSPTVQRGHEILRICLHSFNTKNELQTLMEIVS